MQYFPAVEPSEHRGERFLATGLGDLSANPRLGEECPSPGCGTSGTCLRIITRSAIISAECSEKALRNFSPTAYGLLLRDVLAQNLSLRLEGLSKTATSRLSLRDMAVQRRLLRPTGRPKPSKCQASARLVRMKISALPLGALLGPFPMFGYSARRRFRRARFPALERTDFDPGSFHRICDGLKTVALVDGAGLMVELIDIHEWARPPSDLGGFRPCGAPLPDAFLRATLCGGHLCLGFDAQQARSRFSGRAFSYSTSSRRPLAADRRSREVPTVGNPAVGRRALAARLFSRRVLNLAEHRRSGLLVSGRCLHVALNW